MGAIDEVFIKHYLTKFRDLVEKKIKSAEINNKKYDVSFLEKELEKYLIKSESNYYTKSLLYRESGQYINDIYVDLPLYFKGQNKCPKDILKKIRQSSLEEPGIPSKEAKFLISGIGGSGKSILMKKLFLELIIGGDSNQLSIPILIRLKSIKDIKEGFFENYIINYFCKIGVKFEQDFVKTLLKEGNIVLLLDGLDELKFDKRVFFIDDLELFLTKYNKTATVISTRPESVSNKFPMFDEYKVGRMSEVQVKEYISKLPHYSNKKELIERITEENYYRSNKELVGHPLILAILILTFDFNGEVPVNSADFYSTVYNTMLKTHDMNKEVSFSREIKTKLSHRDLELLFTLFCFYSYIDEQYSFSHAEIIKYLDIAITEFNRIAEKEYDIDRSDFLCDLTELLCFIVEEGIFYDFIHRSFQEYYTAKFILLLNDEDQTEFFNEEDNNIFLERGGVLNYLRLLDERKFIFTGIYPILKDLVVQFDQYSNVDEFIRDNVDIIDIGSKSSNNYYVLYEEAKYSIAREEILDIKKEFIEFSVVKKQLKGENYGDKEFELSAISERNYEYNKETFAVIVDTEIKYIKEWLNSYENNRSRIATRPIIKKFNY